MFGEDSKETVMIGACESSLWNAGERAARISNPNCRHLGFTVGITLLFDGESAYCRKKLRTKGDRFSMKRTATTVLVFLVLTLASASTSAATLAEGSLPVNITVDECAWVSFNAPSDPITVIPDGKGFFSLSWQGSDAEMSLYANRPVKLSAFAGHDFGDLGADLAANLKFAIKFSSTGHVVDIPLDGELRVINDIVIGWSDNTYGSANAEIFLVPESNSWSDWCNLSAGEYQATITFTLAAAE